MGHGPWKTDISSMDLFSKTLRTFMGRPCLGFGLGRKQRRGKKNGINLGNKRSLSINQFVLHLLTYYKKKNKEKVPSWWSQTLH
jgi:hypothetical protein